MTVAETTTLDQVAEGPDGRVLLAMTEDRAYAAHDAARLIEDLRLKLDAYVHLVRSGQLAEIVGRRPLQGVEIRLFCVDPPPTAVLELWDRAAAGLAGEGVALSWELLAPSTDELLYALAESLIGRAPAGWSQLYLQAILVGGRMSGGLSATLPDGTVVPMQPDDDVIAGLQGLKRSWWTPEQGTWLTLEVEIEGSRMQPAFSTDEPDGCTGYFDPADWAEELQRYPRPAVPAWWQAQLGKLAP